MRLQTKWRRCLSGIFRIPGRFVWMSGKKDLYSKGSGSGLRPYFSVGCKTTLFVVHSPFNKSAGICSSGDYRQINMGNQREMIGWVTFFPSRLNNCRGLDPGRSGNKNIVQLEPEKESAKPVKGYDISISWISYPKGVH